MAGIGFVLRRLAGEDNLSGIIRAFMHSAVIAVGPWLMIIASIASILSISSSWMRIQDLNEVISIFVYNLCFSFILSGPLYMIAARYVSDCLYMRQIRPVPGILIGSMYILFAVAIPFGTLFYLFYASMSPIFSALSIVNFLLLCHTWIMMLFLGLLRDFRAITLSWLVSTVTMIMASLYLEDLYHTLGILMGINIGLCVLVASLTAHIFAEYPYIFKFPINFYFYFRFYRGLFWSGLFFFASMWIDKAIMWLAPEAMLHANNLNTYPTYDGAMFLAYLTIVPILSLFIFDLETNFYDSYIKYIQYIEGNAPLSSIEEEEQNIVGKIAEDARSFLVLQGSITLIFVIFSAKIFNFLGAEPLQLSIFRLGTIGAFFAALNFFIVIIFSYFDSQSNMLKVTLTMFFCNSIMSLVSMLMGFQYYGYGFCLAMISSFVIGGFLLINFLKNLTYHIFITNNVKRQDIREEFVKYPID